MTKKTLTIASVLLLLASVAFAQNYLLPWNTLNNGGVPGSSPSYGLNSTLAQPVQGFGVSPSYMGYWGFWYGVGRVRMHDVGINLITIPTDSFGKGTVITPTVRAAEFGDALRDTTKAFFKILDRTAAQVYLDSTQVILDSGSSYVATFPHTWSYADSGHFTAVSYTVNIYDANHANDTTQKPFYVKPTPAETGWVRKADVPAGGKAKNVKDGGALAYKPDSTGDYVYAFKGNGRAEFYRYSTASNTWATKESIPAIGSTGKKKFVKKGAVLATASGKIYGAKGGSTLEWWQYAPGVGSYAWAQKPDIPLGGKALKEGGGAATVTIGGTDYVYLMKGSGTYEWYRYNTSTNVWETKANAPAGLSGKAFKDGSCIAASEDGKSVFAAKASYNEFYSYSVDSDKWTTLTPLPLIGRAGKKLKLKSGAGMAYHNKAVYVTKGNNTVEFWQYVVDSNKWVQRPDWPLGGGKKPKGGGALVYASGPNSLYALKGNNTLEYWKYGLSADLVLAPSPVLNTEASSITALRGVALTVSPNPFVHATQIAYSLPRAGNVSLKLYDVTGKLVSTLVNGYRNAGTSSFVMHPTLSCGIYLLKLETENATTTTKLIIE